MKRCFALVVVLGVGCGPDNVGQFDCTDPATCADSNPCTPNALRCGPNKSVEQCKADGSGWMPLGHCDDTQSCAGGQCSPASCTGMTPRCTTSGQIETCIPGSGAYSDPMPCPVGQTCLGTSCVNTVCQPNQRFCIDATTVGQCDAIGANSTVVDHCTGNAMCANGSCLDSCAAADILKSFNGCQFYAVDMNNDDGNDTLENDILVANSSPFTATVKVEVKNGPNWSTLCMAQVPANMTHPFALTSSCDFNGTSFIDRHVEDSALVQGNAYRITSDAPIVAYYINSDDKSGAASSSGSMVLLPRATYGKKYYALSWPQPAAGVGAGGVNRASMDIVASADQTMVTVHASTNIVGSATVPQMMAGDQRTFMLNEGDVLQMETLNPGDDLTGTYIEADKPIGLFTGVECAINPNGGSDCDHMEEQVLPLVAWGKNYVAPRIVGQSENCGSGMDPVLGCPASEWRILASEDATTVTLSAPPGVTLNPAGPISLMAGQVQEVTANGTTTPADFFIAADKPILVMQETGSETAMVSAVPAEQYLPQYLIAVPDFFCTTITIVRKMGSTVLFDGMAVADSQFKDVGGGYQAAHMPVPQDHCGVGLSTGQVDSHLIKGVMGPEGRMAPPGIELYGVDINCSYGYVGGLNINVINPVE